MTPPSAEDADTSPSEWGGKSSESVRDLVERHLFPRAGLAVLDFGLAGRNALGADDHLPGDADQVHVGELAARTHVAVVVQHLDALGLERVVELGADTR